MRRLLCALSLLGWAAAAHAAAVPFSSQSAGFSCELASADWAAFEEQSPRGVSVHFFGPAQARGAYRAAYHVHFFEKDRQGFLPVMEFMKVLREREKLSDRGATPPTVWRVSKRAARVFEAREERLLPTGRLPAELIALHHFYALVPAGGEGYFLIKLSTTEESFLDFRAEFRRFLESFLVYGD